MASPNLMDVLKISGEKRMAKKVIKAEKANKKVEKLTKEDKENKPRSAKEVRGALYGSKE